MTLSVLGCVRPTERGGARAQGLCTAAEGPAWSRILALLQATSTACPRIVQQTLARRNAGWESHELVAYAVRRRQRFSAVGVRGRIVIGERERVVLAAPAEGGPAIPTQIAARICWEGRPHSRKL
eukprot:1960494-Rhodomonas_salina.2